MKPARATRSVVLLGCAALLGACTDDPEPAAESPEVDTSAPPSSGTALRADYVLNAGEAGRANIAVITGAPDQIRISWVFRGDDPVTKLLLVYDGKQLLEYGSDPGSYTLYRVPEDAEAYDHVRAWVLPPGSDRLAEACPDAEQLGDRTIAGRAAVGYRCNSREQPSTLGRSREIWVDEESGLTLEARGLTVESVTPDEPVDGTTFSTEPPEGVDVDVRPPEQ